MNVTEIDKFGGVEAEPKQFPDSRVRMQDVAVAAGVSRATVSNVINHPHLVAAPTRERVQAVVRKLGFQPNPHAKALRGLGSRISKRGQDAAPDYVRDGQQEPLDRLVAAVDTGSAPLSSGLEQEILEPGKHLSFRVGTEFLSGIVDAVMPDKSYFWIYADSGMGRRLIDARETIAVGAEFGKGITARGTQKAPLVAGGVLREL